MSTKTRRTLVLIVATLLPESGAAVWERSEMTESRGIRARRRQQRLRHIIALRNLNIITRRLALDPEIGLTAAARGADPSSHAVLATARSREVHATVRRLGGGLARRSADPRALKNILRGLPKQTSRSNTPGLPDRRWALPGRIGLLHQ